MVIRDFYFYIKGKLVRKGITNKEVAKSLLEKAEARFSRIERNKVEENETSMVFEDVYEALMEASQSLMELKSFKPYSHEAVISFLKQEKILSEEKLNRIDNYRILRNNSVYKAERVSMEKCTEAIEFTKGTLKEIKEKFNELTKVKPAKVL